MRSCVWTPAILLLAHVFLEGCAPAPPRTKSAPTTRTESPLLRTSPPDPPNASPGVTELRLLEPSPLGGERHAPVQFLAAPTREGVIVVSTWPLGDGPEWPLEECPVVSPEGRPVGLCMVTSFGAWATSPGPEHRVDLWTKPVPADPDSALMDLVAGEDAAFGISSSFPRHVYKVPPSGIWTDLGVLPQQLSASDTLRVLDLGAKLAVISFHPGLGSNVHVSSFDIAGPAGQKPTLALLPLRSVAPSMMMSDVLGPEGPAVRAVVGAPAIAAWRDAKGQHDGTFLMAWREVPPAPPLIPLPINEAGVPKRAMLRRFRLDGTIVSQHELGTSKRSSAQLGDLRLIALDDGCAVQNERFDGRLHHVSGPSAVFPVHPVHQVYSAHPADPHHPVPPIQMQLPATPAPPPLPVPPDVFFNPVRSTSEDPSRRADPDPPALPALSWNSPPFQSILSASYDPFHAEGVAVLSDGTGTFAIRFDAFGAAVGERAPVNLPPDSTTLQTTRVGDTWILSPKTPAKRLSISLMTGPHATFVADLGSYGSSYSLAVLARDSHHAVLARLGPLDDDGEATSATLSTLDFDLDTLLRGDWTDQVIPPSVGDVSGVFGVTQETPDVVRWLVRRNDGSIAAIRESVEGAISLLGAPLWGPGALRPEVRIYELWGDQVVRLDVSGSEYVTWLSSGQTLPVTSFPTLMRTQPAALPGPMTAGGILPMEAGVAVPMADELQETLVSCNHAVVTGPSRAVLLCTEPIRSYAPSRRVGTRLLRW